jgi:hypothetical protein
MSAEPFIVQDSSDLPDILWDGQCSDCREDIGNCWIGGDDKGHDLYEFTPYWVHTSSKHHTLRLCAKCHAFEMEEVPEYELLPPEEDQPLCGGYIIIHARATDRVYFGPFATYRDALVWARAARRRGVSGFIQPLTSSSSDMSNIWHDVILPGQLVQKTVVDSNY